MPAIPSTLEPIEALRRHKASLGITNEALATAMTFFGWDGAFSADSLDALFAGRTKLSDEARLFINAYILSYYISTI